MDGTESDSVPCLNCGRYRILAVGLARRHQQTDNGVNLKVPVPLLRHDNANLSRDRRRAEQPADPNLKRHLLILGSDWDRVSGVNQKPPPPACLGRPIYRLQLHQQPLEEI